MTRSQAFERIGAIAQTGTEENPQRDGFNAGRVTVGASGRDSVAAWLSKQTPRDMDQAAVSRASSHGVGLMVRYESRFPSGPNGERLPSYSVAVGCEVHGSPEAISAALQDLRNFTVPAPIRQIEAWLAELSVIVARRPEDAFSEELRVTAYASRLSQYPADVVRSVLLHSTYKFWPTWEELEKQCRAMSGPRMSMIAALERGPEPPEIDRSSATAEERERIQALIDEMFPEISSAWRERAAEGLAK